MKKINFRQHPDFELGDTHLTYRQISEITGYKLSTTRTHTQPGGPLEDVPKVRVAGLRRLVALRYTSTLHWYLNTWKPHIPTERLCELLTYMSAGEVAKEYNITEDAIRGRMHANNKPMPDWRLRLRRERAYTRMKEAQRLYSQGGDPYIIADILGVTVITVKRYLKDPYPRPPPIPNRTPVWEQDHNLW